MPDEGLERDESSEDFDEMAEDAEMETEGRVDDLISRWAGSLPVQGEVVCEPLGSFFAEGGMISLSVEWAVATCGGHGMIYSISDTSPEGDVEMVTTWGPPERADDAIDRFLRDLVGGEIQNPEGRSLFRLSMPYSILTDLIGESESDWVRAFVDAIDGGRSWRLDDAAYAIYREFDEKHQALEFLESVVTNGRLPGDKAGELDILMDAYWALWAD